MVVVVQLMMRFMLDDRPFEVAISDIDIRDRRQEGLATGEGGICWTVPDIFPAFVAWSSSGAKRSFSRKAWGIALALLKACEITARVEWRS